MVGQSLQEPSIMRRHVALQRRLSQELLNRRNGLLASELISCEEILPLIKSADCSPSILSSDVGLRVRLEISERRDIFF